jgi:hypothetical protein
MNGKTVCYVRLRDDKCGSGPWATIVYFGLATNAKIPGDGAADSRLGNGAPDVGMNTHAAGRGRLRASDDVGVPRRLLR